MVQAPVLNPDHDIDLAIEGSEYHWTCAVCLQPAKSGVALEFQFIENIDSCVYFDFNQFWRPWLICVICDQKKKGKGATWATLGLPWTTSNDRNGMSKLPKGRKRNVSPKKLTSMRPNGNWPRRELNDRSITGSEGPLELILTLSLIPLRWCEYTWAKQEKYEPPEWSGDLWSISPMDHQQIAAHMVCSWDLVKAYQQTW